MDAKITKLAEGEFERSFPAPETDPKTITSHGTEGNDITGSFRIYTDGDVPLEGHVYSSNPYVTIKDCDFAGKESFVEFCAHIAGFYPGQEIDGSFTIITDGYEKKLPYHLVVDEKYPAYAGSEITDLTGLYELEKADRRAAVSVFASEEFRRLLARHFYDSYLSYRALSQTMGYTPLALETFLCENGIKERVRIHVFPEKADFYSVSEDVKESFRITRNTDGYIHLHFEVPENSFIELGRTEATDEDFFGGTLEVPFFIKHTKLHEGINSTVLTIYGNGFRTQKVIRVSTYGKDEEVYADERKRKKVLVTGVQGYLDFRLRKTGTKEFLSNVSEVCEYFLNEDPSDIFALLYRTMAQIVAGEKQQAIATVAILKEMITDKKSFEWAFLLYLCTLMDPEESYIDRITAEIEEIAAIKPDDSRIFWFLLFLRREYTENPLKRLTDIRKRIIGGAVSPVFYAEALDVYNAYPQYIVQLDSFSVSILRFGLRQGVLAKDTVPFVSEALSDLKEYSAGVCDLAEKLYDRYMDENLLSSLISYLLRNRCTGKDFAPWYRRGIEAQLNLTGIFESYMYSVSDTDTDMLPRMLVMYFSYDNDLSEEKREYLYANVITYKDRRQSVYDAYIKQIERFAIEKLQEKKINDNLSIIYRDLYNRGFFDRSLTKQLAGLKDQVKVFCLSQESGKLSIYTNESADPIEADLNDHAAIIDAGGADFFPVLTNQNGVFTGSNFFYTEKLLPELSEVSDGKGDGIHIDEKTETVYADRMIKSITDEKEREDADIELSSSPLLNRDPAVVTFCLRQMIEAGDIEKAYGAMQEVYGFYVPENLLLRLATDRCSVTEEKDVFLSGLCIWLLDHYLSNDVTLSYLCTYFEGDTDRLISVFLYAKARGCDVRGLCERILSQLMLTEDDRPEAEEVYESYRLSSPDSTLAAAYLTYYSDRYVLGSRQKLSDGFFRGIKDLCTLDTGTNESMKTALLKYYSTKSVLTDEELKTAEKLLRDSILSGKYMMFFKKLDMRLIREFGLYERVFAGYNGKPGQTITITATVRGNTVTKEMTEVYDGRYIATFILFRDESLEYSVTDAGGSLLKHGNALNQDYPDGLSQSRFGLINEMSEARQTGNGSVEEVIDKYIRLDLASDDLYSMV